MGYSSEDLSRIANRLRVHVIEMTSAAGSGHPGGSLSSADLLAVLYFRVMRHDPKSPDWADRDRFILSKGHVAPLLYAALAESGYLPVEELMTLRKMGSRLQGHPVRGKAPGVEMSTGSLGQGLSMSCGIALAGKMDCKDYRVFCLLGDGEMQSGQNWEAAMFASHYRLDNLTAIVDRNRLQITGDTERCMSLGALDEKFRSFGWDVETVNGHDIDALTSALEKRSDGPRAIIMNTIKGKCVSFMENNAGFHGKACNCEETARALKELKEGL
ncbi:MAG: transketolase [Candidatus Methanomethylophilaceae archaeon]|nr:transketolase [Candidatus Methanomethylophilaceae archaeon]NLF33618.1 transketolase [Thermoplasmatales archaeon]